MIWQNTLVSAGGFSVFMGLLVTIIQIINPRAELKSYPEGIKKEVEPLTDKEKRRFKVGKIIIFPILLALMLCDFYFRIHYSSILDIFLHFLTVFLFWTIFDLLILDWFVFCTLTPNYLVFPGTEGNKEYKNYKFHLKGVLFGIPFSIILSLLLTLIVLVQKIFS
jgi:hypothetical protein